MKVQMTFLQSGLDELHKYDPPLKSFGKAYVHLTLVVLTVSGHSVTYHDLMLTWILVVLEHAYRIGPFCDIPRPHVDLDTGDSGAFSHITGGIRQRFVHDVTILVPHSSSIL